MAVQTWAEGEWSMQITGFANSHLGTGDQKVKIRVTPGKKDKRAEK
jgi:hypothetical protein